MLKRPGLIVFCLLSLSACASYQRQNWGYPTDLDRDCLNTRQEILSERAVSGSLRMSDCKVLAGRWPDFYAPGLLESPSEIDIDHVVPLKHAFDHGAKGWSRDQRKTFANDPDNLVISRKSDNRRKGSKDITLWVPRDKAYACAYKRRWMHVKAKYALEITEPERASVALCPTQESGSRRIQ